MNISMIAAIGPKRELGKDNKLLWHISDDLKRFKKLTQGHAVIMGRKTYESLEKPLQNRLNIIITRQKDLINAEKARSRVFRPPHPKGAQAIDSKSESSLSPIFCSSLEEGLDLIRNPCLPAGRAQSVIDQSINRQEVFIIGGGQIYAQALPLVDKLYLTLVDATPATQTEFARRCGQADTFFPDYEKIFTDKIFEEKHVNDRYQYSFVELTKHK